MSEDPPRAYIDISAISRWGAGAPHVKPNYEINVTFSGAQLHFNPCMIRLNRKDRLFESGIPFPSERDYRAAYSSRELFTTPLTSVIYKATNISFQLVVALSLTLWFSPDLIKSLLHKVAKNFDFHIINF